jgi:uncharacterized protein (TIGR03083 family)
MSLQPIQIIDTRSLFRPVSIELVNVLRTLPDHAWELPTVAGTWRVRDVAAHLVDGTLRRLAFQRDRHTPPAPARPVTNEEELVAFINQLNAQWISVAQRFSTRVLTDLYASASAQWSAFAETLPIDAPALFPVSWAGDAEYASAGWFDLGREFTELMHHQAQIRDAVGLPALDHPAAWHAFVSIAVLGLPHAFRNVPRTDRDTFTFVITGNSGGTWTLRGDGDGWSIWVGEVANPTTRAVMSIDNAWRLLFNALPSSAAAAAIAVDGDRELAAALINARSVIV